MAIGYLIIQARTAHGALPLSGIQVKILDDNGNPLCHTTVDAIKKLNGLTSDLINVGQVLKIPTR